MDCVERYFFFVEMWWLVCLLCSGFFHQCEALREIDCFFVRIRHANATLLKFLCDELFDVPLQCLWDNTFVFGGNVISDGRQRITLAIFQRCKCHGGHISNRRIFWCRWCCWTFCCCFGSRYLDKWQMKKKIVILL